jgi:ATP-dependent Clp protease ATP-binding subunit ClpC
VLALAIREAKWLGHAHVGTEHILLGFLKEGDGIAGRVLSKLGVKLEPARKQILKNLDQNFKS